MALMLDGRHALASSACSGAARPSRERSDASMMYGYAWDTSSNLAFALSILPILGIGLMVTLQATAAGFAIALVLGLGLALLRRSRIKAVAWTTAFVVEFMRDTPLLVQLFFLYYVLPDLRDRAAGLPHRRARARRCTIRPTPPRSTAAASTPCPRGQWEAATALT